MSEHLEKLRKIAADARTGHCVDCRFFMEAETFQKKSWFGLRKNISTSRSVRFAQCAAHQEYASLARVFRCKGRDFEVKS